MFVIGLNFEASVEANGMWNEFDEIKCWVFYFAGEIIVVSSSVLNVKKKDNEKSKSKKEKKEKTKTEKSKKEKMSKVEKKAKQEKIVKIKSTKSHPRLLNLICLPFKRIEE